MRAFSFAVAAVKVGVGGAIEGAVGLGVVGVEGASSGSFFVVWAGDDIDLVTRLKSELMTAADGESWGGGVREVARVRERSFKFSHF
jgi:hypothetical protein